MSSKVKARKRAVFTRKKNTKDEEEIIEIEEFPDIKPLKNNENKNDNNEVSSSEATSTNKKSTKKKKGELSIEIKDIEIPLKKNETIIISSKSQVPGPIAPFRKKNSATNLTVNNKEKKKEKKSVNSNSKIIPKEKSPKAKEKRKKNIASISLEESDNDNQVDKSKEDTKTVPDDVNKSFNAKKHKSVNKSRETSTNTNRNKNKKNQKEQKIKLSSEEKEEKKVKEKGSKTKTQKEKKVNKKEYPKTSLDKSFNSISDFSKTSKKNKNNIVPKEEEAKSEIKLQKEVKDADSLREKIYNFLGKKRKPNNKGQKSRTPNKDKINTQSPKIEILTENNVEKKKSRTPLRNYQKATKSHFLIPTIKDVDKNCDKKEEIPELVVLNKLIKEYGFEKVLNTLCKSKLDEKDKFESSLQHIKNSCSESQLHILLFNALFSYFESKFEEIKNTNTNKKSDSPTTSAVKKYLNDISNKNSSFNNVIEINSVYSMKDEDEEIPPPIQIEEDENKRNKKNNTEKERKEKSPLKEEKKKTEKFSTSIGSHYNKDEKGKVFKYQVISLDKKGNANFKCYDAKCCGAGIYEIKTKKFSVTKKHNLRNEQHNYIKRYEKEGDEIIKELIEGEKSDVQVFKQNGKKNIVFY